MTVGGNTGQPSLLEADASPVDEPRCGWCDGPIPDASQTGRARRSDSYYCSKQHRQAAWRLRQRLEASAGPHASPATAATADASSATSPRVAPIAATRRRSPALEDASSGDRRATPRAMRFAYADPPYPGKSGLYRDQSSYAGEVDHVELIERLERDYPDGYALSTGAYALRDLLPLLPPYPATRICPWVKPHNPARATRGIHNCWEPLLVVRGRQEPPGRRDWLKAHAARHGGDLIGRKPLAFAAFLFEMLGADPATDTLEDLYPGTGIIGQAWTNLQREVSRAADRDSSRVASADASAAARALTDAAEAEQLSLGAAAPDDASPEPGGHVHDDETRAA